MIYDYVKLVERISKSSGLSKEDIDRRVEGKRAKLSGLVSKEGAAQIVAAELGINFEKDKIKINELMPGMRKANLIGKIIRIFPVKEFNKNGRQGKVANFILADETGNIRVVLWDTNHISLIENKEVGEGDSVEIANAAMRNTEVHLTAFSDIKKSSEVLENVKEDREFFEKKLKDVRAGDALKTRAFIVHSFEPRFFDVCPECGTKAVLEGEAYSCAKHGKIMPEKRALLNVVLDDGSENFRAVMFSEQITKLGIDAANFVNEKEKIMGKEAWFSGTVRLNKLFNNPEFYISDIEEIDIDKLVESLENNKI